MGIFDFIEKKLSTVGNITVVIENFRKTGFVKKIHPGKILLITKKEKKYDEIVTEI